MHHFTVSSFPEHHLPDCAATEIFRCAAPPLPPDPCSNPLAASPHSISVQAADGFDERALNLADDSGLNASACIDMWAPGGGIGLSMIGASADSDTEFVEASNALYTPTYIVAGIAAQYLSTVRPPPCICLDYSFTRFFECRAKCVDRPKTAVKKAVVLHISHYSSRRVSLILQG